MSEKNKFTIKNIFKQNLSRKTKIQIATVSVIVLVIIGYIIWDVVSGGPLTQLFTDRDRLIKIVNDMGVLGPLAYIFLQALQGVVAPIPSNLVGIIGGFIFGWAGILWTTIGATIGAAIVFWLSRRFGRRLVEKLVKKEALDRFDFIVGKRAGIILFLIFIIPGLPDDIVCYIAGFTDIPIKKLILIFAIGRLPAVISNNYIGMGLSGEGDFGIVITIVVITVIIVMILYKQQDKILNLLKRQNQLEKENKSLKNDIKDLEEQDN